MSFAYTTSEMQSANRRFLATGILATLLIIAVWMLWFFFFPVTVYADSNQAILQPDGTVEAAVAPATLLDIFPGQAARFRVQIAGNTEALPARVLEIDARNGLAILSLQQVPDDLRNLLVTDTVGIVEFEITRTTPASLVVQVIGAQVSQ